MPRGRRTVFICEEAKEVGSDFLLDVEKEWDDAEMVFLEKGELVKCWGP